MGHRLLVVDSDRRFLQDHKASLESAFDVDFREGTEGSLSHLENGDFAAILLCVEASENKGYSLCSAIRRSPLLGELKVALISGKATEEEYARHQSLKGRADLYLHKPIRANALISALTPLVPLRSVDPDNPLGDLGGADLGDEWLESLKSELEIDVVPHVAPAPAPVPAAPVPVPVATVLGFTRPLLPLVPPTVQSLPPIPKDAGRVELLEARVKDLETKLVTACDDLDRKSEDLAERVRNEEAAQAMFEEKTLLAMELETGLAAANAALERGARVQEELRQQAEEARDQLQEKTQSCMDMMESNQLLQAQLAEAREEADRLARSQPAMEARIRELEAERIEYQTALEARLKELEAERTEHQAALEARIGELEAERNERQAALERAESSENDLRMQLAGLAANHERQQMELLAAIDDREARAGRMESSMTAQREQIQLLEQEKENAAGQLQARSDRLQSVIARLVELEGQTHQVLELAKTEMT